MTVTVYAFPPVAITGCSPWFERAPVDVSRSFFTGARMVSAAARKRREAHLVISGLAGDRNGAGYMENLRILLAGGENLVRLTSRPVTWWQDDAALQGRRQSQPVVWKTVADPAVDWTNGNPVHFFTGVPILGEAVTDGGGFPAIAITRAPASLLIARPGDLVTLFSPLTATTGASARVLCPATTDAAGAATIRLMQALSGSGRVNIGTTETAAFELKQMSDPVQPLNGDWSYTLGFSEVFADECGGFLEVDPWR